MRLQPTTPLQLPRETTKECSIGNDFELTPFGAGRRICPGIFIALFTVELSLANLLHKFDWEMPSGINREDIDMNDVLPGICPRMRDALCLVPKAYAIGHK
ncbi:hypothetical protein OIU78_012792 [Salix suchowensis]|nr:hypothetical protein OIU78_012792 [Salix suchowensis]